MAWEAWVEVLPDLSGFAKKANQGITSSLSSAGSSAASGFQNSFVGKVFSGNFLANLATQAINGVGQAVSTAISTGIQYSLDGIQLASDLSETKSAITQVFGDAASDIIAFSETATTRLGQTQQESLAAAQTFGIFARAAGLSGKPLSDFSTRLVDLSADLASFYNSSPQEAIDAIGAGLRGEAEPLRRFGVLLDDAALKSRAMTLGIYDGTGALTQQQRVLAAQAEIFAQTGIAQGDFERTSGGLANQQKILEAQLLQTQAALGEYLLPGFNSLVSYANAELIPRLGDVIDKVGPKLGDALTQAAPKIEALAEKLGPLVEQFATMAADEGIPAVLELLDQMADAAPGWIDAWSFLNDPNAQPAKFLNDLSDFKPFGEDGLLGGLINDLNASQRITDSAKAAALTFTDSYAAGVKTADGFDRASDYAVAALSEATDRVTREGSSGSFGAGENYADALAAGILAGKIKIGLAGYTVAQEAVKQTKVGFQQRSPSRLGLDIGGNFTKSIGTGMVDELDTLRSAANQIVAASTPSLVGDVANLSTVNGAGADLRPYLQQLIEETAAKRIMVADGQVLAETASTGFAQQAALGAN